MPIYEFKCKECGKVFEHLCFRSDDEDRVSCPSCGKTATEKLLSVFSSGSGGETGGVSAGSCASPGGFS